MNDFLPFPNKMPVVGLLLMIFFLLGYCQPSFQQGKQLYRVHCENCHGEKGEGLKGIIPPVAGTDYLIKKPDITVCAIRHGMKAEIKVNGQLYERPMPGNDDLSAVEIANIINFINYNWNDTERYISANKVKLILSRCDDK